ncbi:MAG: 2-hydroxyacyl-CoA dehydratase family protein [Spirochaetes bacterium]|nr:2-hydroxyacyl-CoA dehydratase family protein [Spirochaetota bacterium]
MSKSKILIEIHKALDELFARFSALKNTGKKIIFTQCDSIPYEVFAAHGCVVSKLPRWVLNALCGHNSEMYTQAIEYLSLADMLIVPKECNNIPQEVLHTLNIITVSHYEGFAQDAVVNLHSILWSLLQSLGVTHEYPDNEKLTQAVATYEEIRKIMRALTTMYNSAFTQKELQLLCDAAFTLEPEQSIQLLQKLYHAIELYQCTGDESKIKMLIYNDYRDWEILDEIRHCGITIAEDDSCNGRRQFDISCHTSSQNMYYELLYAYSFKSWCPGLRNVSERIELIYKSLPNYDITLVALFQSHLTSRNVHIQNIYEQCLLAGIDAVILNPDGAVSQLHEYMKALQQRQHYTITINMP